MPAGEVATESAKPAPAAFTPRSQPPKWTGPPHPGFMPWAAPHFYPTSPPFPYPPPPNPTTPPSASSSSKPPMNFPYGHPPFVPPFPYFHGHAWQPFWGKPPRRKPSRQNSEPAKIETPKPGKVVLALPAPEPAAPEGEEAKKEEPASAESEAKIEEVPPSPPPPGELVPLVCEPAPPTPTKDALTPPPTPPANEAKSVPPSAPPSPTAAAPWTASEGVLQIYKPPEVNWLLAGETTPGQAHLSFDIRYSPSVNARIAGGNEPRRLATKATLAWAVNPVATEMHIICTLLPWKIRVTNKRGVTVEDVLMRIAEELEVPMTDSERCIVSEELWQRALDARDRNIRDGTGHSMRRREKDETVRRIDWLGENTMFRRLSRGMDSEENTFFTHQRSHLKDRNITWLLELGSR